MGVAIRAHRGASSRHRAALMIKVKEMRTLLSSADRLYHRTQAVPILSLTSNTQLNGHSRLLSSPRLR